MESRELWISYHERYCYLKGICSILDKCGTSIELKNMVEKIIDYYTKFQNNHVVLLVSTTYIHALLCVDILLL
jgi:hypothetical protein